VAYAIPGFLFAILLLVLFAGGSYLQIFPLRGLTSDNWDDLSLLGKIGDYFWHITLPVLASTISSFATLTLLTKNSFLDEIKKQYVITAKAKGLSESRVLYGHVFRNAMLIVIAGFPALFIGVFFGASIIIETIFSLDGLGRLGFEAAVARDYPVIFGTLFVFGLISLVVGILSDLMYVFVDPRIDFETRGLDRMAMPDTEPPAPNAPDRPKVDPRRAARAQEAVLPLSPLNQRRWRNFTRNRRAYWSLIIFGILFGLSLFAEFLANDKPILVQYRGASTRRSSASTPRPSSAAISGPRRSIPISRCSA
jgi:hypothetical protein